jgi:membrane-bound metal-dependent hydrolase YbcI (DUF457 family)
MANAFFRRRIGPEAVPILAIASNLPDVDAIVHLTGDTTAILLRRTFGHSIFMFPIWSFGLALILRRFYPRLGLRMLFGLSLLGAAVHVFFDLINSFGVVLLWPLSDWRPELAIVFIIDPFLTGLLAAPLLLGLHRRMRRHLVLLSRASMACVVVYLLFCGANRIVAQHALAAESQRLHAHPDFAYVFPEPLGPQRWKGVLREKNLYRLYLIHSLTGRIEPINEVRTQIDDPNVERVRDTVLARRLEWFFKAPVWKVMNGPKNHRVAVSVYDLRFRSVVIHRGTPFVYFFIVPKNGPVRRLGG